MMDFLKLAKDIEKEIIDIRRDFHMYPELGFDLQRTSSKVKEFLKKEKIEFYETAQSGICAMIYGNNGDKTIGIRGDMDALPIDEKNDCSYKSKHPGKMHACGHDAHTAILMGTAKILNNMKNELNGNVKLFFEPAEETVGGARVMISEGVLNNPNVNAVIGLHVEEWIDSGKIGIKKGVVNAASNPFKIKIIGSGGHGASPHSTIDPIVISSNVICALQNIVSREIPPTDAAVITIGSIHGGTAQNIIPDEVNIEGIMRCVKKEHRELLKKRLKEVTEGIVTSMRAKCEIEIQESYPCLYNEDAMVDLLIDSAEKVVSSQNIIKLDNPSMGVESFAYFAIEKPAVFYYLGCRNTEKGIINAAHNSKFDIDEKCLAIGTAIQCQTAWEFLK